MVCNVRSAARAAVHSPSIAGMRADGSLNFGNSLPAGFRKRRPRSARRYERASSMTILVTGGAGYIGSHMVHALLEAGERVLVLDNLATGFDWAVARDAPLVIGDVGDQRLVSALMTEHRIDAIIHFAASVVVPDSVRDP